MRKAMLAVLVAAILMPAAAEARRDTRSWSHFATGHCKRSSCFAKHPGGTYRFPYHYGHRRH